MFVATSLLLLAVFATPAPCWRELIALDVPKMIRDSKLPILVLQGDQDIQVRKDVEPNVISVIADRILGR